MKTGEAKVKDDVKAYLESVGAYFYMPVPVGYGKSTLDFLVCWRGRFVGIETKAPGKCRPTARQHLIAKEIAKAGGFVIVTDRVDMVKREFEARVA
jgi:hypothetical protein